MQNHTTRRDFLKNTSKLSLGVLFSSQIASSYAEAQNLPELMLASNKFPTRPQRESQFRRFTFTPEEEFQQRREEFLDFYTDNFTSPIEYTSQDKTKPIEYPLSFMGAINTLVFKREKEETIDYQEIVFNSSVNIGHVKKHPIKLEYYPCEEPKGTIIVLPMLGGASFAERYIAEEHYRSGFSSIVVNLPKEYRKALGKRLKTMDTVEGIDSLLGDFNDVYTQSLYDGMQAISWVKEQEELKDLSLGVVGLSFGGIGLASMMGLDDRIDAGVMCLAGGDIPYILAYSEERGIKKDRKESLEKIGKDQEWVEEQLRGKVNFDPMDCARYIDGSKAFLIIAKGDDYVPIEKGRELGETIGDLRIEEIKGGHIKAALKSKKIIPQMVDFFEERLI